MKQFLINEHNTGVTLAAATTETRKHVYCVSHLNTKTTNEYDFYFYTKKEALDQARSSWDELHRKDQLKTTITVFRIDLSNVYDITQDGDFSLTGYNPIKEYSL